MKPHERNELQPDLKLNCPPARPVQPPMPFPRYVFLDDQGRVFSSHDDPTAEDFAYAAVGMVTIVRVADFHCYGSKKKWLPIPAGELVTAELDEHENPPFHTERNDERRTIEPAMMKHRPSLSSQAASSEPADAGR